MTTLDLTKHLLGYGRQDPATGMLHGQIRWPHGTTPPPSGCRWCGREERDHGCWFVPRRGFHTWVQPTQAQIKARMLARRNAVKSVCRCPDPMDVPFPQPFAPVVDPWKCEAEHCRMHDFLLGGWLKPLSFDEAAAQFGGEPS
ncbi:hypothetical protein [Streptomyces sp. OM5714]|uniref:hypothetical protein n=1 Tax=Streptomyces sp. OM5714 TaxID=2602736 RepID=UPI001969CA39|nr:hypothetical protein [Streptomyces sp. OM5714]KAF2774682.1 hypothetical protein STPH1_7727 [Streptomyces sp. OM5714]